MIVQVRAQRLGPRVGCRETRFGGRQPLDEFILFPAAPHPHLSLLLKSDSRGELVVSQHLHPSAPLPGHPVVRQGWVESRVS